jgi:hypothetical protein
MAFTPQELAIIQYGKDNGKSVQEIQSALARVRTGVGPATPTPGPAPSPLDEAKSVTVGAAKGAVQTTVDTARALSSVGRHVIAAATPLTMEETNQRFGGPLIGDQAKAIDENLKSENPAETAGKGIEFGAELLAGGGASLLRKGAAKLGGKIGEAVSSKVGDVATAANAAKNALPSFSGVKQMASEFAERVPRFIDKAQQKVEDATARAERIRTSAPAVQTAIKSGLDNRIVSTVQEADAPTAKAYKEMVDLAENAKTGKLKVAERPEIVAGRAAEDQYKLIEKQRKAVGAKIGDAVDALSKTEKVPMEDSYAALDNVLSKEGIKATPTKKGVKLDFTGTHYTPAERTRIQQLYDLATEGGDTLTPRQIRDKDQLFSKLQRETRLEGIGDIIVNTDQGSMSLFRVFRDVYANKLDQVAPEIKGLNKAYRNIVTLQDDIENSIIKSGKYETSKGVDAAEFAQTNLRRLSSDALSAADYRAIAGEMDSVARQLGYNGAKPEDLALFANELRKLFPATIPATSFSGGIRTGLVDILKKASDLGAPDITDQQKALKQLIESALSGAKK